MLPCMLLALLGLLPAADAEEGVVQHLKDHVRAGERVVVFHDRGALEKAIGLALGGGSGLRSGRGIPDARLRAARPQRRPATGP